MTFIRLFLSLLVGGMGLQANSPADPFRRRSDPQSLEGSQCLAYLVYFPLAGLLIPDSLPKQCRQLSETGEGFTDACLETVNLVDGGFKCWPVRCLDCRRCGAVDSVEIGHGCCPGGCFGHGVFWLWLEVSLGFYCWILWSRLVVLLDHHRLRSALQAAFS